MNDLFLFRFRDLEHCVWQTTFAVLVLKQCLSADKRTKSRFILEHLLVNNPIDS